MLPFADGAEPGPSHAEVAPGAVLLRGFALPQAEALLAAIEAIAATAPFRHQQTPGGKRMSVAMTNCGALGWVTDRRGYRYEPTDPLTGAPWPPMPSAFAALAAAAALAAGYPGFRPDACLVNRYAPGARMTLHQDQDEQDFRQPIVSVSLGLPARFQFGGLERHTPTRRIALEHGDVFVFGGPSRRCFHGVLPLRDGAHPVIGAQRYNLTFRVAG